MSGFNNFLSGAEGGSATDGTLNILGATLSATNLDPSLPCHTDVSSKIITKKIVIGDTTDIMGNPATASLNMVDLNITNIKEGLWKATNDVNTANVVYSGTSNITIDLDALAPIVNPVTSAATITNNTVVVGSGGSRGVQDSTISINSNNIFNSVAEVNLLVDSDGNTKYGYQSLNAILAGGIQNTAVGHQAGWSVTTGDYNTCVGHSAMLNNDNSQCTAVGNLALFTATSALKNTAVGRLALQKVKTGADNSGFGAGSGSALDLTSTDNTTVGVDCLGVGSVEIDRCTAVGAEAARVGCGDDCTMVGYRSNYSVGANISTQSVLIGNFCSTGSTLTDNRNVAVGYEAFGATTIVRARDDCVCVGYRSGNLLSTGDSNIYIGANAGRVNTTGSNNINIGNIGAVESGVTRIGTTQTSAYISGIYNVTPGSNDEMVIMSDGNQLGTATIPVVSADTVLSTGTLTNNVLTMGAGSKNLQSTTIGVTNNDELTAVQSITLLQDTLNSTTFGYQANDANTASRNVAIGENALQVNANVNSVDNVALGTLSLGLLNGGVGANVAIGSDALNSIVTGFGNCAIGHQAGSALTLANSDNIMIVNDGTVGDSGKIRIGNSGDHSNCFIAGIHSVTPSNAGEVVIIDSNGELGSTDTNYPNNWVYGLNVTWLTATTLRVEVGSCKDSTNAYDINSITTISINTASSGANGLDTGSMANDTWYAVYIIADSSLSNDEEALISLDDALPTLPGTHDLFRRIGWVKTEFAATSLHAFWQRGISMKKEYNWELDKSVTIILSEAQASIKTTLEFSSFAPTTCREVIFNAYSTDAGGGDVLEFFSMPAIGGVTVTNNSLYIIAKENSAFWRIGCNTSQQIQYSSSNKKTNLYSLGFVDEL